MYEPNSSYQPLLNDIQRVDEKITMNDMSYRAYISYVRDENRERFDNMNGMRCSGKQRRVDTKLVEAEEEERERSILPLLGRSLGSSHPSMLLLHRLESTVSELGARVDELELDLLQIPSARVDHQTLPQRDNTLLGTRDRALEHNKVVLDDTVMREATKGSDRLGGGVVFSGGILLV